MPKLIELEDMQKLHAVFWEAKQKDALESYGVGIEEEEDLDLYDRLSNYAGLEAVIQKWEEMTNAN